MSQFSIVSHSTLVSVKPESLRLLDRLPEPISGDMMEGISKAVISV